MDSTERDLQAVGVVLGLFATLEEQHADTYLTQIRRACEELYRRAQLASRSFVEQLPQPLPRQDLGCRDPVAETHREKSPMGRQPVGLTVPNTVPNSDALLTLPQGGDDCAFGNEPQLNGIEFNPGGSPRTGQTVPYPWLEPWGLDMLLERDFAFF